MRKNKGLRGLYNEYIKAKPYMPINPYENFMKALGTIYEFSDEPNAKPRDAKHNKSEVLRTFNQSWVCQQIARPILSEVMRAGIEPMFYFKKKCVDCGEEFDMDGIKECPVCGSKNLRKPEASHLLTVKKIIEKPNSGPYRFRNMIKSQVYYDMALDEFYTNIASGLVTVDGQNGEVATAAIPMEVYVQSPEHIKPVIDDKGRFMSNEYVCPVCDYVTDDQREKLCPHHNVLLRRVNYVQEFGNKIKARWGEGELIYGSSQMVLPYPFGVPRALAAWEVIESVRNVDRWFYDTYKEGQIEQIIAFPEHDQDEVDIIAISAMLQKRMLKTIDSLSGEARSTLNPQTLMLASHQPPTTIKTMYDPGEMRTLEYYMMVIQGLCTLWGVQPIYVSIAGNKEGTNRAMLEVKINDNTVREYQNEIEAHWRNVFKQWGITDAGFRFKPLQGKDRLNEANINNKNAMTVATLRNSGINASLDENMNIVVDGLLGDGLPVNSQTHSNTTANQKVSEATDDEINNTTVEGHERKDRVDPE